MGTIILPYKLRNASAKLDKAGFTQHSFSTKEICFHEQQLHALVLKPFIDKLSLRFNLPDGKIGAKGAILKKIKTLHVEISESYDAIKIDKSGYRYNFQIKKNGKALGVLQASPYTSVGRFFSLTFNPSQLTQEEMSCIKEQVQIFTDGALVYEDVIALPKTVEQLHVAVDILGVAIDDLEANYSSPKKSVIFMNSTGRNETVYLSGFSGYRTQTYFYDKRREQLDNGNSPIYGETLHVRVERRIDTDKSLKGLQSGYNPFNKIKVRAANYSKYDLKDFEKTLFVQCAISRNLEKALRYIPDEHHKDYQELYETVMTDIWDAKKIWGGWKDCLERSHLL